MSGPVLLLLRLALAGSLFLFIGWAYLTLWRDLQVHTRLLELRQPQPLTLVIPGDEGRGTIHFKSPVVILGRDPTSDFILDEATVSAQHARLSYAQTQWWLEDLGSKNGTFLNEEPVEEPTVITNGDRIRCGQMDLDVIIGELAHD
jgi:pSer/pThr/pTyr-binding forkhead associated (FHA) protein